MVDAVEKNMVGLVGLGERTLTPAHEADFQALSATSLGQPVWQMRKRAELRELLALSEIADRFQVVGVDVRTDFRALVHLRCPVPCLGPQDEHLRIEEQAVIAICWPEEAIRSPLPGHSFAQIVGPREVYLPNVSPEPTQLICLGTQLPVGLPVREIILMSFGVLTMQTVMLDEQDPSGVMSADAALYWQARPDLIPLTDEPFLASVPAVGS